MTTPYFDGLTESGIITRIVYQLILIDWRKNPERYVYPANGIHQLAREMRWYKCQIMHVDFAAASEFISAGRGKLKTWRDLIVERNRYRVQCYRAGKPWTPIGAPPVSNTGGTDGDLTDIEAVRTFRVRSKRNRRKSNGY